MSYRPPMPGSSPGGFQQPGNSNRYVSPGKVRDGRKKGIPWVLGCGLLLMGFVLGVAGILILALLVFGSPVSNQPFPARQPVPGITDLSATLSESYLNAETLREVKANPYTIAGIFSLKDISIKILPGQQFEINAKLGNSLVDFDVSVTESASVVNNKIVLRAIGEPKVGKGNLPISTNQVVQAINDNLIEPQLNRSAATIKVNDRQLNLIDLETQRGLLIVRYNAR